MHTLVHAHLAGETSNGTHDESAVLSAASATDANELALTVKRRRMLAEKEREERAKRERELRLQRQEAEARAREEREFANLDREYKVCV